MMRGVRGDGGELPQGAIPLEKRSYFLYISYFYIRRGIRGINYRT